MKDFRELTIVGRGRRLRPLAERVLKQYGIERATLRQMTGASNTIFRVDTADGRRYVLRMTAPKSCGSPSLIRSEIQWLRALSEDPEISVPHPVAARNGDYVISVQAPGVPGERHCALFTWLPGTMLADRLTPDNVRLQGQLAARLHRHAAGFRPTDGFDLGRYETVFPYSNPARPPVEPIVMFDGTRSDLFPPSRLDAYRRAHDHIQSVIDRLYSSGEPVRVIHNDLHVWNLKIHRGEIQAFDFEDLLWGHPVQDIATALYYYRYRKDHPLLIDAFRDGYESVAPWPETEPGQVEALIAGRAILLANFVAASDEAEDRALAPEYIGRVEGRLRAYLEETGS